MKLLLLLTLFTTTPLLAKNLIIAHFDPFDGAKSNNSETIARQVTKNLKQKGINVLLCPLETSFEKAYPQLENCINKFPADLTIVLGETGCKLKAEFVGRNLDKTYGPDNSGVERDNTPIVKNANPHISLRYPLPQMYCGLSSDLRKKVTLSNNAGSFVCNNVAFQMRYNHQDKMMGLIHVPSHFCKNIQASNIESIKVIEEMILTGLNTSDNGVYLPHYSNSEEIPMTKDEIRRASRTVEDKCYRSFYQSIKGVDSRGIWPF